MATSTLTPSNDGYILCAHSVYNTAADGLGTFTTSEATTRPIIGQQKPSDYQCYENFYKFDTSSIPNGATIINAVLSIYVVLDGTLNDFTVNAYINNWVTPLSSSEWVTPATMSPMSVIATLDTTTISSSTRSSLTGSFAPYINKTGYTDILLVSDNLVSKTAPTLNEAFTHSHIEDTATQEPELLITYISGGLLGDNF